MPAMRRKMKPKWAPEMLTIWGGAGAPEDAPIVFAEEGAVAEDEGGE